MCMYVVSKIELSQNVHVSRSLIYLSYSAIGSLALCLCDLCEAQHCSISRPFSACLNDGVAIVVCAKRLL